MYCALARTNFVVADVLKKTLNRNLVISTDVPGGISGADIVFIAVNTGTKDFGHWVSLLSFNF